MPEVPLYTFNFFDPSTSVTLGTVIGKHAEAISLVRGAIAGIKSLFGGKASEIEKKVSDATEGAKNDLYKELSKQYPNATSVIGVNIQVCEMGGFIIIMITGTAVGNKSSGGSVKKNKTLKIKHY